MTVAPPQYGARSARSVRVSVGIFRSAPPVEAGADLARILALPRRAALAVDELTELLATPGGQQRLRPAQALALYDAGARRGLLAPIKCGGGKTLVSLLLAQVIPCARPVLLVPAALRERTARDAAELSRHWQVWLPRILGYEALGRVSQAQQLELLRPDLLICDEAHRLANLDAAVTRRVDRYVTAHQPAVCALSGTLLGDDLLRVQHLARWCLGARSPLPLIRAEAERWQEALYPEPGRGGPVGALRAFGSQPAAGLARWIRDSCGVVGTEEIGCGASLEMSLWRPELPSALRSTIAQVLLDQRRPDGVDLLDDFAGVSATISQLALGFWYRWDPPAPVPWLLARRDWGRFVREVLDEHTPGLDTELQVRLAYPQQAAPWLAIRDSFEPNPVPVWETSRVIEQARDWARGKDPGIVWTRYRAVGEALAAQGLPYHGQEGLDARGRFVEQASGPIAASIRSCSTGANLQRWRRSLVLTPPATAGAWEQLLSRTHREGQTADTVECAVIRAPGVAYHAEVLRGARDQAGLLAAQGDAQRLTSATWLDT